MKINIRLRKATAGIVLREVLAIISIVVLLLFLANPAMQSFRATRNSMVCLSNLRHLGWAWQLYADDNSGKLVQNLHGGDVNGGQVPSSRAPWAIGWMDWFSSPDNTNILYLRDPRYARLGPYITTPANVHKCPADRYLSNAQKRRVKERVRSVSMNLTVGDGNAATGPWDPSMYKQARRMDEFLYPSPRETMVILEEHPDSINDPAFFPPLRGQILDFPANYHQGGMNSNFADGHADSHVWRASARRVPVRFSFPSIVPRPGDADLYWLSYHSQRIDPRTY